jgi:hypothetical protein
MSLYKTLFETPENKFKVGIVGMVIITIMLAGVFSFEAGAVDVLDLSDIEALQITGGSETSTELVETIQTVSHSGYVNENSQEQVAVTIEYEMLLEVSCDLTWTDEVSTYFQGTNEPDELGVFILNSGGTEIANSGLNPSGSAQISTGTIDYQQENFEENFMGEWMIVVEAGDCGDDFARFGIRSTPDNGNDYSLEISIKYLGEPAE